MTLGGAADSTPVLLVDVCRSVLGSVGLRGEAGERLLDQVMTAYRKGAASGCTLRFTAHAGEIEIALSKNGSDFRASSPVPVR